MRQHRRTYWYPGSRAATKVYSEVKPIQFCSWGWANDMAKRRSGKKSSSTTHTDVRKTLAELPPRSQAVVAVQAELVLLLFQQLTVAELKQMESFGRILLALLKKGQPIKGSLRRLLGAVLFRLLHNRVARLHHALWLVEEERTLGWELKKKPRDTHRIWTSRSKAMAKDRKLCTWISVGHCLTLATLSKRSRAWIRSHARTA